MPYSDTSLFPDSGPPSLPGAEHVPVRVVLVEAVPAQRLLLLELLGADPRLRVVADFADPLAVAGFLRNAPADVVLMDLDAPGGSALEGCRRIMESHPLPVVLCSAGTDEEPDRARMAGAVCCVGKPQPGDGALLAERAAHMRLTLQLMAEVRVVRRRSRTPSAAVVSSTPGIPPTGPSMPRETPGRVAVKIIGIGASTGRPPVLQALLADLPADFPVPILVVQHIAAGFLPGMVQWLRQSSGPQVEIAAYGMLPLPGHVYLGPDDCQMGIGAAGRIVTSRLPGTGLQQPSVAFLFRTLADHYGAQAAGVLLSGMGKDGAPELKRLRDLGATTIAQDRETSVVYGMPGEAIALGGATHVLPAGSIAGALRALVLPQRQEGT